jgi:hypothetical protein
LLYVYEAWFDWAQEIQRSSLTGYERREAADGKTVGSPGINKEIEPAENDHPPR